MSKPEHKTKLNKIPKQGIIGTNGHRKCSLFCDLVVNQIELYYGIKCKYTRSAIVIMAKIALYIICQEYPNDNVNKNETMK